MRAVGAGRDERAGMVVGVAIILCIAFAARLYGIGEKPPWLDEVITINRAGLPVPHLLHDSLRNRHLPGFFLIERLARELAPVRMQIAALRFTPALAGAVSAGLVFAIARQAGGRDGAWLAGLLMAFAPQQVAFSQEARSYTMMMAPLLLALAGLLALVRNPDAPPRASWPAYAAGTAVALLILPDALPWPLIASAAFLAAAIPRSRARKRLIRSWGLLNGGILILVAPAYALLLLTPHHGPMAGFRWIPAPTIHFLLTEAASLYGLRDATMVTMRLLPTHMMILAPAMAVLAILGIRHLRAARGEGLTLLIAWLGQPAALCLLSLLHPLLLPRYLLWSAPPFFILAGLGLDELVPAARLAVLPAAGLVLVLNLAPYYHAETRPRWDLAANLLAASTSPGDIILASDGAARIMLGHYDSALKPRVTRSAARARAALATGHAVYAVYGPAGQGVQPSRARFMTWAARIGRLSSPLRAGAEISIRRVGPAPDRVACSAGIVCR